jgi:hypothetical protein
MLLYATSLQCQSTASGFGAGPKEGSAGGGARLKPVPANYQPIITILILVVVIIVIVIIIIMIMIMNLGVSLSQSLSPCFRDRSFGFRAMTFCKNYFRGTFAVFGAKR